MRALPSPAPVPARQRYKRVARAWTRPWLAPAALTPRLVRAVAGAGAARAPTARRTWRWTACAAGRWEVFTLGVVWHGRVLVGRVGGAALPVAQGPVHPDRLRAGAPRWRRPGRPTARPTWWRTGASPASALFRTLRAGRAGAGPLRLRARTAVTVGGRAQDARALLATARPGRWTARPGTYGTGPQALAGTLVVGRGLPVRAPAPARPGQPGRPRPPARRAAALPAAQAPRRGTATTRARPTPGSCCSPPTRPGWPAVRSYGRRWAIEGSYRDAQGGWDGRHGWDLERTLARLTDAGRRRAGGRAVGAGGAAADLGRGAGHRRRRAAGGARRGRRVDHDRPAQRLGPRPVRR